MRSKTRGVQFFKTTVLGGLVFLVPVVVLLMIFLKAVDLMMMVAEPMADKFPVDSIGGVALANLIAAAAIVVVCFLSGLVARGAFVRNAVEGIETKVLSKVPGYVLIKGMLGRLQDDEGSWLHPVLVQFAGSSRIGLEIERSDDGYVVVLIPSSPNPWSGPVHIISAALVKRLDLPMSAYMESIERFGSGTHEMLKNLDIEWNQEKEEDEN